MKRLYSFLVMLCTVFSGCGVDSCPVGNWQWANPDLPYCQGSTFNFRGAGGGELSVPDCFNDCSSNASDSRTVFTFSWGLDDDLETLTVNYSGLGTKCGNSTEFGQNTPASFTGTMVCSGDTLQIITQNKTYILLKLN